MLCHARTAMIYPSRHEKGAKQSIPNYKQHTDDGEN